MSLERPKTSLHVASIFWVSRETTRKVRPRISQHDNFKGSFTEVVPTVEMEVAALSRLSS